MLESFDDSQRSPENTTEKFQARKGPKRNPSGQLNVVRGVRKNIAEIFRRAKEQNNGNHQQ